MKVSEVVTGSTYLVKCTDVEHRKDLIGQQVTITGRKRRGKGRATIGHNGILNINGGWIVFKTSIGRNVSACELSPLPVVNPSHSHSVHQ